MLAQSDQANAENAAQEAIAAAIPEFFERELSQTSREFSHTVEEILAGHHQHIETLVNLVRRTAADLFDVPYMASAESDSFKLGREPYWVTQRWSDRLLPNPNGLVNRLLSATLRQARLRAELQHQIDELVSRNVENLRWATRQGLDDTFRRFATMLDGRLTAAIEATQGAVTSASTKRSTVSDHVESELAELRRFSETLAEIRAELAGVTADEGNP